MTLFPRLEEDKVMNMSHLQIFGVVFAVVLFVVRRAMKIKDKQPSRYADDERESSQELDDQVDLDYWDEEDEYRLFDESQ